MIYIIEFSVITEIIGYSDKTLSAISAYRRSLTNWRLSCPMPLLFHEKVGSTSSMITSIEKSDATSAYPCEMKQRRLYGIWKIKRPIQCVRETLGTTTPVLVGGVAGYLQLPSLPSWTPKPDHPLDIPLVAPVDAKTWKQGDSSIHWGSPNQYPSGASQIEKALLYFDVENLTLEADSTKVSRGFLDWRKLFIAHFELLTRQRRINPVRVAPSSNDLDLFLWSDEGKAERPYKPEERSVTVIQQREDTYLTPTLLEKICRLASEGASLTLPQKLQLDAYRAIYDGDYRKAIIETAVAAELALTEAIRNKFLSDGITYGDRLTEKFRMLGGRLELATLLQLPMPGNLKETLIKPRNSVIHNAELGDEEMAIHAVNATDELFALLNDQTAQ